MNVASRFRYSTVSGMEDFATYTFMQSLASSLKVSYPAPVPPLAVKVFRDFTAPLA